MNRIHAQGGAVLAAALISTLAFGADANSFGERVEKEGAAVAEMGREWQAGNKLVAKGEAQIAKGEKHRLHGEQQVNKGRALIEQARANNASSRDAYDRTTNRIGGADAGKEALAESKQLQEVGARWEVARKQMEKGEAIVKDGEKHLQVASELRRSGEGLVQQGRQQMGRVEATYSAPPPATVTSATSESATSESATIEIR